MSQASPTGFLLNRTNTSSNSFWSFGPAWMVSFKDSPSHLAEQSNTMRTLVVVLFNFTIGKCGKYQDGDEDNILSGDNFRR